MKMLTPVLLLLSNQPVEIPKSVLDLARRYSAFNAKMLGIEDPAVGAVAQCAPGTAWRDVADGAKAARIRLGWTDIDLVIKKGGDPFVTGIQFEFWRDLSRQATLTGRLPRVKSRQDRFEIVRDLVYAMGLVESPDDVVWENPGEYEDDPGRARDVRVGISWRGNAVNADFDTNIDPQTGVVWQVVLLGPPRLPIGENWTRAEEELLDISVFQKYAGEAPFAHAYLEDGAYHLDAWPVGMTRLNERQIADWRRYNLLPTYRRVYYEIDRGELTGDAQVVLVDFRDGAPIGRLKYSLAGSWGGPAPEEKPVIVPITEGDEMEWHKDGKQTSHALRFVDAPAQFAPTERSILTVGRHVFIAAYDVERRTARIMLDGAPRYIAMP